ncbi:hypothetical protein A6R68_01831 [Neotoma lepida]|uniref:Leucine-rich repeat-containing protein 14 n=1 Tax=Neotoma lepida TaxID=56216 RepID=A0A1A6GUM4_NEOLE|nr:hypothetical protein A6R68_01831 [Neotoma lepida]
MKMEGQLPFVNSGSMINLPVSAELIVDLSLDGSLVEREFLTLIMSKLRESSGALHICCRVLQVDKLCDCKYTLKFLDLICVDQLSIANSSLSDINNVLSQKFLLFSPYRVLPLGLDFLYLTFCDLSFSDFRFLAQSPQASRLKLLNLSNNPMYWDDFEPFQTLLMNISGTLKRLEINNCLITDSAISVLIPALIRCTHLHVLGFASNPITMPMLVNIVHNLTPLKTLKYVIYPIPVHCYDPWPFQGSLDRRKLAIVQLQLKAMLQLAERDDMTWITSSD